MQSDFSDTISFAVAAALFEGGLAVLAACIGWAIERPPLLTFQFNVIDLLWGISATFPPLLLLWLCVKFPWRPFAKIMQILDETFVPLFRQCRILELAVIALLAGLGEEMLFRGIVQAWVTDKVGEPYGVAVGLGVSAAIFGLLHSITLAYAILAAVIGLYLGVIWRAADNLLVPITSHALYDFLALIYFVRLRESKMPSAQQEDRPEHAEHPEI
jgi:membrane protease YdiL (CAAX protease family)